MSDTSGLPSAIGIEAVEWLTDDPSGLTVRITGRWRRRRPDWRGPAMLVIEAEGRRHRISAMPEPPFLIGLLPGMWRMSFSIPPELADHLEGGTWLALGAVMVPISLARPGQAPVREAPVRETPEPEPPRRSAPDRDLLAARELRSLEVAADSARRRARAADELAAQLREQIASLQEELVHAREEPERLRGIIAARERDLRRARQGVHAEAAQRAEREGQLAELEQTLERLRARARGMAERQVELERDLRRMHRTVDEAQREAAIAREAAMRVSAQARPAATSAPRHDLTAEFALAAQSPRTLPRPGPTPVVASAQLADERAAAAHPPGAQSPDATLQLEFDATAAVLEREREARRAAEHRVKMLAEDLERQRERSRRALAAIEAFRRELAALRSAEPEPATPPLIRPTPMPAVPQPPRPEPLETSFEPDRLSAALARLREQRPPEAPAADVEERKPPVTGRPGEPRTATTDALPRLFRALAREDPLAAGRLVLALLPAQRRVHPRPLAYDLVLGAACVRVTVGADAPAVEMTAGPRSAEEVQFRIDGDPAALARLLSAGPLRARWRRGRARVHGDRGGVTALRALIATPLSLDDLLDAGVSLDPGLALRLVAQQVGTSLAEPLTIAHRPAADAPPDAVLHAAPGRPPAVLETSLDAPATTTIVCAPGALLSVLAGREAPGASIRGEARPLALVRRALQRA